MGTIDLPKPAPGKSAGILRIDMRNADINILRDSFSYNSETGELHWKTRPSQRVKVGDLAGGRANSEGYLTVKLQGRVFLAHRVCWACHYGSWPISQIDHINGVKTDNRIDNIRIATFTLNRENIRKPMKTNKTGFLGVTRHRKTGRFEAQIQVSGKKKYLGIFNTAEEAHSAYLMAKRSMHFGCTI